MYYYFHRWYDPSTGRFISPDPKQGKLNNPQILNLYIYVIDDPTKGNYAFYGKFPAKYTVPQHWHTDDCMVAIIKCSMRIDPENAASVNIQEGGFFKLPGQMRYVAHTPKETIFLVWGTEPFDIHYANPKDDPRNK